MNDNLSIKVFKERVKKENELMDKIIFRCKEKGVDERFCKAFYGRISEMPLLQTKAVCDSLESADDKQLKIEWLKKWKVYLDVCISLFHDDSKTEERKESLKLVSSILECNKN